MQEIFAYLKDVLGIKYLPMDHLPEVFTDLREENPKVEMSPVQAAATVAQAVSAPPATAVTLPTSSFDQVQASAMSCTLCALSKKRKVVVFGEGALDADLMFVGEAPGELEDTEGKPFVGPAGDLLGKMIKAMGFERSQVYITTVVKCRPAMDRTPEPPEIELCSSYLEAQIRQVRPKVVVALGTVAAQTLLKSKERIAELRGRTHKFQGIKLIATYHPSYLLRKPAEKRAVWEDLQLAMRELKS